MEWLNSCWNSEKIKKKKLIFDVGDNKSIPILISKYIDEHGHFFTLKSSKF